MGDVAYDELPDSFFAEFEDGFVDERGVFYTPLQAALLALGDGSDPLKSGEYFGAVCATPASRGALDALIRKHDPTFAADSRLAPPPAYRSCERIG